MQTQRLSALPPYGPRDPLWRAWRMAAIYRCCLRYEKDEAWALEKVREVHPDGSRDGMVGIWFMGMEEFRASWRLQSPVVDESYAMAA
jgi:hypothetical protein